MLSNSRVNRCLSKLNVINKHFVTSSRSNSAPSTGPIQYFMPTALDLRLLPRTVLFLAIILLHPPCSYDG
jgi:hypothetical protein